MLGVGSIEVRQKSSVRVNNQPGRIIRHRIPVALDVVVDENVSVEALVEGLGAEKVSRSGGGGGRAFT